MSLFLQEEMNKIDAAADKIREFEKNSSDMKTYYVNEVRIAGVSDYDHTCIGLFSGEYHWHGEGNFCGWYGAEFYDDMTLVAYYVIENSSSYSPQGHVHIKEEIVNQPFDKIPIGSCYWTQELYAKDDQEAIGKFFHEGFISKY